ncbi:MAG: putative capsular polysaccharide synthesis family protein [Saprospiraceae bacterium]
MQQFLGIEPFKVVQSHVSDEKPYGVVYKKFLQEVKIPEWYVDKMFNSRFAQHFFSKNERQEKMAYWLSHPRH